MISPPSDVTILGIDPGYDRIGWSVGQVAGNQLMLVDCGCILTDKKLTKVARYQQIYEQLGGIVAKFLPTEAAVESLFFSKNVSTALPVSEARGVIMTALFQNKVKFFEYTPNQIKVAVTGNGRADKRAIQQMVLLQLRLSAELKQKVSSQLDDTLDAIAIAIAHTALRPKLWKQTETSSK